MSTAEPFGPDLLRQFVAGRDVPCPGCGYNVRDLANDVCPECGQRLVLSVRLGEPRQAALIAGLIGLSAGAGLGGLLIVYGLIVVAMYGGPGGFWKFFVINSVGFGVHALCILAWVRAWNRIRRLGVGTRRMLVIVAWTLPLLFVVMFAMNIR